MIHLKRKSILMALFIQVAAVVMVNGQGLSNPKTVPGQGGDTLFQKKPVLALMEKVADWQLKTWESGSKWPWGDWTNAAGYPGIFALGTISKKEEYFKVIMDKCELLNWQTGARRFHADDYCIGQTYSLLYMKYKDKKMIASFKQLADSIILLKHDESLEWKNEIALREWAWCDALYMGPPALSYLSTATGDKKYLDIATRLWWKTTDYLYDTVEHLYARDGRYFNKREKNGQKVFWSRGNGWVLAGLVKVLENMPVNYPDRKRFVKLYQDMSLRIASLQQPDGSWHASLLDPGSYPIKEMSGTGFYCYSLIWGINHGLLDKKTYWPVIEKAWRVMVSSVNNDGMLGFVQPVGAAPDKVDENSTAIYGVGAFLLTGVELYKYLGNATKIKGKR